SSAPSSRPTTLSISESRAVTMMTGTEEVARNCLQTSVPDMPGNIKSSNTISTSWRSNSANAVFPSCATMGSNPSFRSRNASGSANDSSSSTMRMVVMRFYPFDEKPLGQLQNAGQPLESSHVHYRSPLESFPARARNKSEVQL